MDYFLKFVSGCAYIAVAALCIGCLKVLWVQGKALSNAGFFKARAALALATLLGMLAQVSLVQMLFSKSVTYDWTMYTFGVFVFGYSLLVQLAIAKLRFTFALIAAAKRGWDEEVKLHESTRS